jgi:hypothetical protein
MPTSTYIALATVTLTGNDSDIVFASIPGTYRDLVLVGSYSLSAGGVLVHRFNGSSSSLSRIRMSGGASPATFCDFGSDDNIGEYATSDGRATIIINIIDYSATNKHKAVLCRSAAIDRNMAYASRWESTAAITSYTLATNQAFTSGSTFTLYGIAS